jgi:hypothetical protein
MRTPFQLIANPGAGATVQVYDSGAVEPVGRGGPRTEQRVRLCLFADQIITINQYWYPPGGATKRLVSTAASVANTFKGVDLPLWPGRNTIELVTTTGPATFEANHEVIDQSS